MKSSFTAIFTNALARAKESLHDKFLTRFYTEQEGEFYDLGYDEALSSHHEGARRISCVTVLNPRGFVAPAWLLGKEAERAARDAEMEYTTRLHKVCDLRSGDEFAARSIVYSVRRQLAPRRLAESAMPTLFRYLRGKAARCALAFIRPIIRIRRFGGRSSSMIERAIESRTATTYQDWIAEQRLRRGM